MYSQKQTNKLPKGAREWLGIYSLKGEACGWPPCWGVLRGAPELQRPKSCQESDLSLYVFQAFTINRLHIYNPLTFNKLVIDILLNGELRI